MPIPFLSRTCLAAAALALGATAPLAAADYGTLTITASPTPAVEGGAEAWFEIRRTPGADLSIASFLFPIPVLLTGSALVDSPEADLSGADVYLNDPASYPFGPDANPVQLGEGGGLSLNGSTAAFVYINPFAEYTRIRVRAYSDGVTEPAETLTATLTNVPFEPDMRILQRSATVTIVDRKPLATVSVTRYADTVEDAYVPGGKWEPSRFGAVFFSRTGGAEAQTVNFTLSGTATLNEDYWLWWAGFDGNDTSIVIPPGQNGVYGIIVPYDDAVVESTETVVATLQPGNYQVAQNASTARVSILDNDAPPSIAFITSQVGPGQRGTISWLNPGWEMSGSGAGIAGVTENATEARYPYVGNSVFTARIASVGSTSANAQVGILLRDGLGNKLDTIFVNGARRIGIAQQNVKGGGIATTLGTTATTLPVWLRAVRQNATITYQQSGDGKTWSTIATKATTLPTAYQAGLFVASGSTSLIKATISSYTANPAK